MNNFWKEVFSDPIKIFALMLLSAMIGALLFALLLPLVEWWLSGT